MFSKAVVIEPSYVLRKSIVSLLREHFPELTIIEEEGNRLLPLLALREESLYFISIRLYLRNKELLRILDERLIFLTFRNNMEVAHVNYLKTTEEDFISIVQTALGGQVEEPRAEDDILTESECNVLKNVALGLSNKEIANKLFISVHTVTTHRKNITRKLDIKSVSGLTVYAILHKLVSINDIQG